MSSNKKITAYGARVCDTFFHFKLTASDQHLTKAFDVYFFSTIKQINATNISFKTNFVRNSTV